jgi:alanyl-tRNA synthetase
MKYMTNADLRKTFITFFEKQGHKVVHSSPVVPANDPTLLFTNAGMVQFKETFLGQESRNYTRATSVQRCIRAGGKHNDLENVGYTARHHTFFEMLGNFSFGDYFKKEAIQFAWDFLTKELGIPEEKLWVTVFEEDQETENIWLKDMGISPDRFSRCGAKDNFWSMGDTGPCGPCSEIFYDHGEDVAGGPPGSPDEDGDRYIEIWNLVFMQFDRSADGTLTPLPKPSVDTGMGLERLAAVMQNVHNNYDIDLFQAIIKQASKLTGEKDLTNNSLRVIADHIRSCAFTIVDGVLPSNEGRGYVLRRIIRRAIRHGYKLGKSDTFFNQLVPVLVEQMGDAYPELVVAQDNVIRVLKQEEVRFAETLENGMKILEDDIAQLTGKVISGATAFKLYDTYGFPFDLTADVAREKGLTVDKVGFTKEMDIQRERARSASNFGSQAVQVDYTSETHFVGYARDQVEAKVMAIFVDGKSVDFVTEGMEAIIILDRTPFYAESGGQIGDSGSLTEGMNSFHVNSCQKQAKTFLHLGSVTAGKISVGQVLSASVNKQVRRASEKNHSATHLLHAALREVLGTHVQQKGSLVDDKRLRFDFAHFEPINNKTLLKIERLVNLKIMENTAVSTEEMDIDRAKEKGAMALFGEKYGDFVRVVEMGTFSIELCGGTHVNSTGEIGPFRIQSETGIASGVRRIEALTGLGAWNMIYQDENTLNNIAEIVKSDKKLVEAKVAQLVSEQKELEKQLKQIQSKVASSQGSELANSAIKVGDANVLAAQLGEGTDTNALRETLDKLKEKLNPAVIVLATVDGDKVTLVAGVSKSLTKTFKAGELVNHVALQVGGKGGGRPDMAQAGGKDPSKLKDALASVQAWAESK